LRYPLLILAYFLLLSLLISFQNSRGIYFKNLRGRQIRGSTFPLRSTLESSGYNFFLILIFSRYWYRHICFSLLSLILFIQEGSGKFCGAFCSVGCSRFCGRVRDSRFI
jgi:hypothetical protein